MRDRANYLLDVVREIDRLLRVALKSGLILCVRLNGSTDIAFEGIRFCIGRDLDGRAIVVKLGGTMNIFDHYPTLQFVDYTKNPRRFVRSSGKIPGGIVAYDWMDRVPSILRIAQKRVIA